MEFRDRIKELRLAKSLTFTQLANVFDKSEGAVRAWETGRTKPDFDTLISLAQYFECSTDYLLGISEHKNTESKLEYESLLDGLMKKIFCIKETDRKGLIINFEKLVDFLLTFQLLGEVHAHDITVMTYLTIIVNQLYFFAHIYSTGYEITNQEISEHDMISLLDIIYDSRTQSLKLFNEFIDALSDICIESYDCDKVAISRLLEDALDRRKRNLEELLPFGKNNSKNSD